MFVKPTNIYLLNHTAVSRIGKKPIQIPTGVQVEYKDHTLMVKGSKGQLDYEVPSTVEVEVTDSSILVTRKGEEKENRSHQGLVRSLIDNMIVGVTEGFSKKLEIIGVGYKAQAAGKKVTLNLGFSHPIEFVAPEGVSIDHDAENKNILVVQGIDKQLVGQVCADIRKFRKPEPYKGKGIRYVGEYVPRKAGKSASK